MFDNSEEVFAILKIIVVVLLVMTVTITVLDVNNSILGSLNFRNKIPIIEGMTSEEKDRKTVEDAIAIMNEEVIRLEAKGGKINGNNIENFKEFSELYKEYYAKRLALDIKNSIKKNNEKDGELNSDLGNLAIQVGLYNQVVQGFENFEKELDTGRFDR
tara:strand:- start:2189 stop:2665 length:477 start_codon:yes stop_codon:yes gene_type:complete